jgi:hypothetical protein
LLKTSRAMFSRPELSQTLAPMPSQPFTAAEGPLVRLGEAQTRLRDSASDAVHALDVAVDTAIGCDDRDAGTGAHAGEETWKARNTSSWPSTTAAWPSAGCSVRLTQRPCHSSCGGVSAESAAQLKSSGVHGSVRVRVICESRCQSFLQQPYPRDERLTRKGNC